MFLVYVRPNLRTLLISTISNIKPSPKVSIYKQVMKISTKIQINYLNMHITLSAITFGVQISLNFIKTLNVCFDKEIVNTAISY